MTDALGSVANITSGSNGATEATYTYEPYGSIRTKSGTLADANPVRFAGEYRGIGGLYNLRARDYDPETGRFMQQDPAAAALSDPVVSTYLYASGNPAVFTDPTGMFSWGGLVDTFNEWVNPFYRYMRNCWGADGSQGILGWTVGCAGAAAEVVGSVVGIAKLTSAVRTSLHSAQASVADDAARVGEDIVGTTHNSLRPTQDWINPAQVEDYIARLRAGERVSPITVQRLPDGRRFILDGHHRYVASMRTGIPVDIRYIDGPGPVGLPDWSKVTYQSYGG